MSVKLGCVAPVGFEDFASPKWLGFFRSLGCQSVQAYRNTAANVTIEQMKDYIAAGQMPCDSIHGVFGEEIDPSCPDEKKRVHAIDTFKKEGDIALALEGPLVVIHGATIRRDGISPQERATRLAQLGKSITELGQFGRSVGIHYSFENLPGYHAICSDVIELANLLDQTYVKNIKNAQNTSMCFDTGHANMVGNVPEMIKQVGKHIKYIHFSDNSGDADEHLMPTSGTLDINAVAQSISEINYSGTVMLEIFSPLDQLEKFDKTILTNRLKQFITIANA